MEKRPATRAFFIGGEGGIRTPDTLARTPVFETGPFNHSGTSPTARILARVRSAQSQSRMILPRACPDSDSRYAASASLSENVAPTCGTTAPDATSAITCSSSALV